MQEHTNGHKNGHQNGHKPEATLNGHDLPMPMLLDGLSPRATEELAKPLDPALVSHRKGRGGRQFPYLEGYAAIDHANRIFGHGGWGYELIGDVAAREVRSVDAKTGEVSTTTMYCATVRVHVPGVPTRTDVGCHAVAEETPEGHDTAYKGSVTDALKRALRSFGDQFGNGLYGEAGASDQPASANQNLAPSLRESLLHLGKAQGLSEEKLKEAVKKRTGKDLHALSPAELSGLIQAMSRKQAASTDSGQTTNNIPSEPTRTTGAATPSSPNHRTGPQAPSTQR